LKITGGMHIPPVIFVSKRIAVAASPVYKSLDNISNLPIIAP